MKRKVIWLSRHTMTAEQVEDLSHSVDGELEIESRNVTWAASVDGIADWWHNREEWRGLYNATGEGGVLAGVFPPVAMEAWYRVSGIHTLSPVSRQAPELRIGDGPIPFVHVRWAILR